MNTPIKTLALATVLAFSSLSMSHVMAAPNKGGQHGAKSMKALFHPKVLKKLSLTDAQEAAFKEAFEQFKTEREANQGAREATLKAFLNQDNITASELAAFQDARKAEQEAMRTKRNQSMSLLLNILTPEQRVQAVDVLKEMKQSRRDKRRDRRGQ